MVSNHNYLYRIKQSNSPAFILPSLHGQKLQAQSPSLHLLFPILPPQTSTCFNIPQNLFAGKFPLQEANSDKSQILQLLLQSTLTTPINAVDFFADFPKEKSTSICNSCKLKSFARKNGLLQGKENRAETEHGITNEENERSALFSWITRKGSKIKKKLKKTGLKSKPFKANGYREEESEGTEALVNSSMSFSDDVSPVKRSKRATCLRKLEGKMGKSFVQVKRSKEPQEDFKRSMVQMILEKEIFETKGLEELLQCYLTLNSPEYHRIIVGAFSEVWEFLFCDSHSNKAVQCD